jgi:ribosomal protein L32
MAKKLRHDNGSVKEGNVCPDCGAAKHPSLDCKKCGGD